MDECSYDGCMSAVRRGNTICKRHQMAEWRDRQGPCSLEGCASKVSAASLCGMHYRRKLHGVANWDAPGRRNMKRGAECAVEDCGNPVQARGWCTMHYQRVAALGHDDPGSAGRLKAKSGAGTLDPSGYRVITVDGKRYLEHRYVMEQTLGRPLWPDEEVHHRNRVRDDNDPSNLELWCTPQPRGGRAEDLVAFYVERYPELAAQVLSRLAG